MPKPERSETREYKPGSSHEYTRTVETVKDQGDRQETETKVDEVSQGAGFGFTRTTPVSRTVEDRPKPS